MRVLYRNHLAPSQGRRATHYTTVKGQRSTDAPIIAGEHEIVDAANLVDELGRDEFAKGGEGRLDTIKLSTFQK